MVMTPIPDSLDALGRDWLAWMALGLALGVAACARGRCTGQTAQ